MKRTVSMALVALCCVVFLSGCSTMKTSWRSTKKLWREYVNTDPSVDLSDQGITDKGQQRLAALVMPVDERLMGMLRALGSQDTPPENEWSQHMLSTFPWLSGVAVLDTSGVVQVQVPAVSMRPLDFAPLLEYADRYKKRQMGALVKTDEFGTVVLVATPYFKENEWSGLVVVSFDPRNLVRFSSEPDALAIMSTEGPVWNGGGWGESLASIKWPTLLKGTVSGEVGVGGGQYVWLARYVGQLEFVYLTDVRAARSQKGDPLQKNEAAASPKPEKAAGTAGSAQETKPASTPPAGQPGSESPVATPPAS